MKRLRLNPSLVALVVITTGLILIALLYRSKHAAAVYRDQLIAAGEKLTIDELWPRQLSDEQNSADLFRRASRFLKNQDGLLATNPPAAMTIVSPGRAMIRSTQPSVVRENATNTWEEITEALAQSDQALDLFEQITEKPSFDFELDYRLGLMIPLRHASMFKHSANLLSTATVADLQRGDTASALNRVRALLALVKGLEDETLVISQLVRIAVTHTAMSTCWEFLQALPVTDSQLGTVQQEWAELDFLRTAEATLRMELAINDTTLIQCRNRNSSLRNMIIITTEFSEDGADTPDGVDTLKIGRAGKLWRASVLKLREDVWRWWWSYPDQLATLQIGQALIETTRKAQVEGFIGGAVRQQGDRLAGFKDGHAPDNNIELRGMFSRSMMASEKYLRRVMVAEAVRQMMVTAIALKRYHLRHESYPPDLAALVPEFLPAVPLDPVDGEPLRYRANDDGTYLLYSVGEDGEDNGGDPKPADPDSRVLRWQGGRDWVWLQPASTEEIGAFFQSWSESVQ